MGKPKINTMKELSKAIGISRPTLARFFEDETSVLPSTAKKIKTALEDVDYVYNFLATRQNRKSTGLIGVVIPQFKDLFLASLLDSIETAVREAGFTMITQCSHGQSESEVRALRKLRSMNVDGAIVVPIGAEASTQAVTEASGDFPIVFVDSKPAEFPPNVGFVGTNNVNSVGAMVDYLCRTGDAPVFLCMPKLSSNALERQEAYFHHMRARGLEGVVIPTPGDMGSWRFERFGLEVMDAHFNHGRYRDATILCANDRIAIGAIRAANTHGLFVRSGQSGGLRIAGHDDHPLSQYISPAVTTVAQKVEDIGKDGVSILVDQVRNGGLGDVQSKLRDGVLRIRESA
ncbi:MAG: LacI family DNA-binding transcriptional regulator [Pseudoruegeria sp.]